MNNNTGQIDTGKNPDLVTFQVLVDGVEIPGEYPVLGITVRKELNRIAAATVTLFDGSPSEQKFAISDAAHFVPGKKIEITAGYHSSNETVFRGIVVRHSVKAKGKGSSLVIECRDEAVKMTVGRKSKYFYESTDSAIMEELIRGHKLELQVESTDFEHREMVQYNASDWDFLVSRAQACGKVVFTDNGKIVVAKPDPAKDPLETVAYGMTLREFEGEIDARNQFGKVTTFSWNQAGQELSAIEADQKEPKLPGDLTVKQLADVIALPDLELRHGGNLQDAPAQSWANAKMLFQQLAKVRGRVRFQGIARLVPGELLKLEGIGSRFNGNIYVTGIQHRIANGDWTVDAQFGMDPVWFSETYETSDSPAAGLLPAVNGLQYGIVSQLEEDPQGECRILVRLPIVSAEGQGTWCRVASLDAGENRGAFFLPEVGDEVIVGFVNQDPNNAIVLGMLNSSAKPAPLKAEDANNTKGFVTRSGMKLLFDDEKKVVTIETPAGKKIVADDDAKEIRLEDEFSNIIKLSSDGISVESGKDLSFKAKGDVTVEGVNVSISGKAKVKATGSSGTELSSNGTTVVKGSLVQIN
jgi:Rhs element Vgr protein